MKNQPNYYIIYISYCFFGGAGWGWGGSLSFFKDLHTSKPPHTECSIGLERTIRVPVGHHLF